MRKILCLALLSVTVSSAAFAADAQLSTDVQAGSEASTNYFNYKSNKCDSIKDVKELFSIAMSLRDSPEIKNQISAVDCLIGAAVRGYGPAEYELARMYSVGAIVTQSDMFAYRWAQLAVMDKYNPAINLRDALEKKLSVEELEAALSDARRIYEERVRAKQNGVY